MKFIFYKVTPNVIVLNSLMSAFARSWRYNELTWTTFESMEGVGVTPDRYSYHILLNACGIDGNLQSAAKVVDKVIIICSIFNCIVSYD